MARQRAGLGRGLNSLLGGDYASALEEEKEPAAGKPASDDALHAESGKKASNRKGSSKKSNKESKDAKGNKTANNDRESMNEGESASSFVVEIDRVVPNPDQPRTHFNEEELEELADSIKKNGLLQPILVRKQGDDYQIIAGERRWQACKRIGLKEVPVRVTEADDVKVIALAMIENIQRADLNPMEEAYGYRMLMERDNLTQAQLAEAVSKGRSTIANTLRLLDLPEDAQQLLFEGTITAGHARAILSIPTDEGRDMLTKRLIQQSISVRDAENYARLIAGRTNAPTQRTPVPPTYKRVAKNLRDVYGTNVRVKSSKGRNKIEIEFKDEAELEEIFKKMVAGV